MAHTTFTTDPNLILFIVYGIIYALGFFTGAYFLIIGAGILLMGTATHLTLFSLSWQSITFMLLLGLGSIYHGIFLIMQERKKDGRK
jgi:membrane protein implicated in regulation of membrane protease activity